MQALPSKIKQRIKLPELTREYSLYEIATITSAGPARALGLQRKGNLGIGNDGDVVVYPQHEDVAQMFGNPRYVIKAGEIVIDDGEIRETPQGKEFMVQPAYNPDTEAFLRPRFEDCYTMSFENYPVELERIEYPEVLSCSGEEASTDASEDTPS